MSYLTKSFIAAAIFILVNMHVFYAEVTLLSQGYEAFLYDMLIVIPTTAALFTIFLMIPYIGWLILLLCFLIGGINSYFLYNFRKGLDAGVINDMLSVELSLSFKYITPYLVFGGLLASILLVFMFLRVGFSKSKEYRNYSSVVFILSMLLFSFVISGLNHRVLRNSLKTYQPHAVFYNIYEYIKNYHQAHKLVQNRIDLTEQHKFSFTPRTKHDPLLVVLIIGESMRGDIITAQNMPYLFARDNAVIFKNARSSGGSTKESIPYMLTSALVPDFDSALQQKGVISIFDHLGFTTSWIGNQGLFGIFETSFAAHALEADFVRTAKDFQRFIHRPEKVVYDGDMLPTIMHRIDNVQGNHFMVIHLLGSHWKFGNHVPPEFIGEGQQLNWCNHPLPGQCSHEQLKTEYEASITYTDKVIEQILSYIQDRNSVVLYSSDHGILLGEDGYIGNAHRSDAVVDYQFNIAMFMWGAPKFLQLYTDKYSMVAPHQTQQISHDFIFHSLLDCIGVQSSIITGNLSLCN